MFTGIVERRGSVARVSRRGGGARLEIKCPEMVAELSVGDSVSVNGACVTVTERNHESFACDLVPDTVARTNLGILEPDELVNLEMPVRAAGRLGGHIVQGHVDAVGLVRSRRRVGAQDVLEVTIPFELTRYLAPQGSVAVDGVSLTVTAVDKERFRVALIPHTVAETTLGQKMQGSSVNVEVDVLSKYVERHLSARASRPSFAPVEEPPKERPDPSVRPVPRSKLPAKKPPPIPLKPAAQKPAAARPAPKKPAPKKPAPRKPAPKKPARARPAAKKKVAKRPSRTAAKRPAAKRPAKRTAAKRTTARRPAATRVAKRARPSRKR
ncbi:MAG TPA: riboflavin synthase [Actinomycetota bacterium]